MATILCLETATTNCSVALSIDGNIVALKEYNNKQYSHSEQLHVYIEKVLSKSGGIDKGKLNAIAVSKGPGSFTGLRIGVSTAKGLCFALDIPLISVPTLESLAHQLKDTNSIIVSMLDARRMEVYSAVYSEDKKQIRDTKAEILTKDSFSEYLKKGKVHFIGNGIEKFKLICKHKNAIFIEDKSPSANEMSFLSEKKFKKSEFEDVAYFEPYYLKDFTLG